MNKPGALVTVITDLSEGTTMMESV
jgi:hypothetical protein